MISVTAVLCLLWAHFVMDFVAQSRKMATEKGKNYSWLIVHGLIYSIPFFLCGFVFWAITLASHIIIDGVTSRITTHFHRKEQRYAFWVTIGADQALHVSQLIVTCALLTQ